MNAVLTFFRILSGSWPVSYPYIVTVDEMIDAHLIRAIARMRVSQAHGASPAS